MSIISQDGCSYTRGLSNYTNPGSLELQNVAGNGVNELKWIHFILKCHLNF